MDGFTDQGVRLPTSADADSEGQVIWSWFDGKENQTLKAHYNQVEIGPRWAPLGKLITLATLGQATAQEVFTQVKDHLLKQGKRSMVGGVGSQCAYRGKGGMQCAAGCLMSDEEAEDIPEMQSWGVLINKKYVTAFHRRLISDLQGLHDNLNNIGEWPELLEQVAYNYGLEY